MFGICERISERICVGIRVRIREDALQDALWKISLFRRASSKDSWKKVPRGGKLQPRLEQSRL